MRCTSVLPDRYWYYNLDTGTINLDFYPHKSEGTIFLGLNGIAEAIMEEIAYNGIVD